MKRKKSLAIVMPLYNESECIAECVSEWMQTLNRLSVDFELIILDDGSSDGSVDRLTKFLDDARITIVQHANRGHGPTILEGYLLACERADWAFQTDSDMELRASEFHKVWDRRECYDAVLGKRTARSQRLVRKLVSTFSRWSVRCFFGSGVEDANVPFRLVRSQVLRPILAAIPAGAFAPNLIISGMLSLSKSRILNVPVACTERRTGSSSLAKWRLLRGAVRTLVQLVLFRIRLHAGFRPFYRHGGTNATPN